MSILSGVSDFFGLDIGSTAIRVVQLSTGPKKQLLRYGMLPIDAKTSLSDSKGDQQKVAAKVQEVMTAAKITTNNVAVGLPSSRVFTMVTDIDRLPPHELSKSIKYQADSLIPTPIDSSKIDWAVIGDSPESNNKVELLLSSVTNDYVESRLDLLESIGLNVIAFEPDNLVLTRSMLPADSKATTMIIDIGSLNTDIVITIDNVPRLIRAVPTGSEAIIKSAMSNLSIDEKQASEFVFKFGLSQQKLEGQVYGGIIGTIDLLVSDIEKSIKFFQTRYKDKKVERIVMTGAASSLPEFPLYIANKLGVNVEIGNSWRNVAYDPARQNELMSLSNHFGVAVGLAERNV